jgi:hypothetical protein
MEKYESAYQRVVVSRYGDRFTSFTPYIIKTLIDMQSPLIHVEEVNKGMKFDKQKDCKTIGEAFDEYSLPSIEPFKVFRGSTNVLIKDDKIYTLLNPYFHSLDVCTLRELRTNDDFIKAVSVSNANIAQCSKSCPLPFNEYTIVTVPTIPLKGMMTLVSYVIENELKRGERVCVQVNFDRIFYEYACYFSEKKETNAEYEAFFKEFLQLYREFLPGKNTKPLLSLLEKLLGESMAHIIMKNNDLTITDSFTSNDTYECFQKYSN